MDHDFISGLVALLERSSVMVLDYTNGDQKIRLVRNHREAGSAANTPTEAAALRPEHAAADAKDTNHTSDPQRHTIDAGMVGTFYRAPGPNQPPFASPGDRVQAGMTLGLVEAMKLLNPIEADCDGRLAEILVPDGASVSRDTSLFVIEST
ncbi:acetyl-CoA carboxylase biotin carboxyl carrier protein [Burkholderia sp. BCC1972]|uniref:acetyl-CoA carboxylase biotin carboxyl carrier protein n=1 Tax=Burkholderia sp. BCC1972 TaxID=2817438 RepID=UPI002ABE4BF3|nr:biotin/lipoyl-containing protein [Burkholderia sp. BCC1972]